MHNSSCTPEIILNKKHSAKKIKIKNKNLGEFLDFLTTPLFVFLKYGVSCGLWPERQKCAKDEFKRLEGPPAISQALEF